jgi:hypothetical protein
MQTECSADRFGFAPIGRRAVVAAFDGGMMTSDAGAMLLGAADRAIGLIERFAGCFIDYRSAELIEHEVCTLVGQRVFGIALGYKDLLDHDELRYDPVMTMLAGKRADGAPVTGKSMLNRLELSGPVPSRYHKISHDARMIEDLFVTLFLGRPLLFRRKRAGSLAGRHRARLFEPTATVPQREIQLRCVVRPDRAQAALLDCLGLRLPERLHMHGA